MTNPPIELSDEQLNERLAELERRLAKLEAKPRPNRDRCRWYVLKGVRFWYPRCWGGLYGADGCYCPRTISQPIERKEG